MIKDRRLLFLGPVLIGLVLLLYRPFREERATVPDPALDRTVAAEAGAATAVDAAGSENSLEPRHPEVGFRTRTSLNEHFRKHGKQFHVKTAAEYLRLAQVLRDRSRGGEVLEFVRNDAVTCKYDRTSGAFVAYNSDGTLRTFFRPRDGEAYFERQKTRSRELP